MGSTFYPFHHYLPLSNFFNDPDTSRSGQALPGDGSDSNAEAFAIFHTYSAERPVQINHAHTLAELQDHLYGSDSDQTEGTMLFLRGYQPRDWLLAIGERYNVEHEFWRRHLNFQRHETRVGAAFWSDSKLPSNNSHMLQLRVPTLGYLPLPHRFGRDISGKASQSGLSLLRHHCVEQMRHYFNSLIGNRSHLRHGDSIVRQLDAHNDILFSIEQDISLWVGKDNGRRITDPSRNTAEKEGWIGEYSLTCPRCIDVFDRNCCQMLTDPAIVWTDCGRNFPEVGDAPWQRDTKVHSIPPLFKPTIQYRPGIMLKQGYSDHDLCYRGSPKSEEESTLAQTACLLHREFGSLLDKQTASQDTYYALSDIFRFIASAEAQFLDMMHTVLSEVMDHQNFSGSDGKKPAMMEDLLYNRQTLIRHIQHIQGVKQFMDSREDLDWSKAMDVPSQGIARKMSKLLHKDFCHLLLRAEFLAHEYQNSMAMLMNAASVDESQRAIMQAEGVGILTTLAFFFVPISFTTSVFGMNFKELSSGNYLSIWVWALTALASLLFSSICLKWSAWKLGSKNSPDGFIVSWVKEIPPFLRRHL